MQHLPCPCKQKASAIEPCRRRQSPQRYCAARYVRYPVGDKKNVQTKEVPRVKHHRSHASISFEMLNPRCIHFRKGGMQRWTLPYLPHRPSRKHHGALRYHNPLRYQFSLRYPLTHQRKSPPVIEKCIRERLSAKMFVLAMLMHLSWLHRWAAQFLVT